MPTLIQEHCQRVDEARLMRHLREFERWEKLSGSKDELENVRYLKQELESAGYRTQLIMHDAYISLPLEARVVVGGNPLRSITHSFSRPSPAGGLTAPLVYVGRGREEDYAGNDVAGRIVVVEGLAVPAASDRATRAGVVGQIHISPYEHIHEMCISPVWGNPSDEALPLLPRTVVCSIANADGEAIKAMVARGEARATLHAAVDTGWRQTPILIGDIDGPDGADGPFVMLSGHQDTWYFGVMDNGTANAAMLEVAQLAADCRSSLKRGLRVAFWSGHSHGRYSGSAWYADEHWHELERRCVAHVNIDSLGGMGNTVLADAPAAAELMEVARDAVRTWSGETLTEQRMSRAGDQSFWGIGVPSLFNTLSHEPIGKGVNVVAGFMGAGRKRAGGAMGWWWHTPQDTLDKIDPVLLLRDTRVCVQAVLRLLTEPVMPFDHRAQVSELRHAVAGLRDAVAPHCDLSGVSARIAQLESLAARLHAATGRIASSGSTTEVARANAALLALSRVLTPLEYTRGDRFSHDPALGLDAFPVLDALRRLAKAEPGEGVRFASVAARQARNRLEHAVEQAIGVVECRLAGLDG